MFYEFDFEFLKMTVFQKKDGTILFGMKSSKIRENHYSFL